MAAAATPEKRYSIEQMPELVASDDDENLAQLNDVDYEELPSNALHTLS